MSAYGRLMRRVQRWFDGDGDRVIMIIRTIEGPRRSTPVRPGQPSYSEQRAALLSRKR